MESGINFVIGYPMTPIGYANCNAFHGNRGRFQGNVDQAKDTVSFVDAVHEFPIFVTTENRFDTDGLARLNRSFEL